MNILHIVILLALSISLSFSAEFDKSNRNDYEITMDDLHSSLSNIAEDASNYIDDGLADFVYEDNETIPDDNTTTNKISSDDEFFLSDKFLNEKRKGYVKLTTYSTINSRSSFLDTTDTKFSARIPLHRFRKRFKVWWENLGQDKNNKTGSDEKQAVGLSYLSPERYGITPRYSLGISSFYPLIRARYNKEWAFKDWDIELAQTFTYFTDDGFEEKTNAYIDTKFFNLSLFRIALTRKTAEYFSGMSYGIDFIGVWRPNNKTGITLSQGFSGNTKYTYTMDKDANPVIEENMSGINKYTTRLRYRKNFYRKWLFYELGPAIDFDVRNNYMENYSFIIKLDVFFGKGYY